MLPPIILASQSPRRKDLLTRAGVDFSIVIRDTEELKDASIPPQELCLHNAAAKAAAVFRDYPDATVIGADTLVFLDGRPLGKPDDEEDARAMLRLLSGRTHRVCTAVSIQSPLGMRDMAVVTEVTFRELSEEGIRRYMELVRVMDKAGAYGIQGRGCVLVEGIAGNYHNVVGLPTCLLAGMLRQVGIDVLPGGQEGRP